jgi:hypothetical protein
MAAHAIPVHRCAELIEAMTGAKPSPGFVHAMIAWAAAVSEANRLIRAMIILAHVICADETPIRAGGTIASDVHLEQVRALAENLLLLQHGFLRRALGRPVMTWGRPGRPCGP